MTIRHRLVVVTELPATAGASSAAFTGYVQGLGQNDDSSDPLSINSGFTLSADDDTSEPIPLT